MKRQKHGEPNKAALAKDVLRAALAIACYYGIEEELKDSIDISYQRLHDEGYIK